MGSRKEPRYTCSFLSNISSNEQLQVPNRAPLEIDTRLQAFCLSLKNFINAPLNKDALRYKPPLYSPKAGPLWMKTPISKPFLTYPSGSSVKEPFLKVPFMKTLKEKCPIPIAPHHSSFKVPGLLAPSRFQIPVGLKWAPMERDVCIQSHYYISSRVPSEDAPLYSRPSPRSPFKDRRSKPRQHITYSIYFNECNTGMKYSYWSYYLWVNTVQYRLYRPHVDNYLLKYMNVKR